MVWAGVGENDAFVDIYDYFFDLYNSGANPEIATKHVRNELAGYFSDDDDMFDAHFALATAQWETQSLEASLLKKVKGFIESDVDLKNWEERESSKVDLKKRSTALNGFLRKIGKSRSSKKRRVKPSFIFSERVLIELSSPDGKKTFSITESYTNGEYIHTGAMLMWTDGGGSIFNLSRPALEFSARWVDLQTLEISIPKSVEDEVKNDPVNRLDFAIFCGDRVTLQCKFI